MKKILFFIFGSILLFSCEVSNTTKEIITNDRTKIRVDNIGRGIDINKVTLEGHDYWVTSSHVDAGYSVSLTHSASCSTCCPDSIKK